MDVVDLYRRTLAEFTDRIRQVGPDQWSDLTPCTDWDVRALVNHVVGEDRWTAPMFAGAKIAEVVEAEPALGHDATDPAGDLLGDDPVANALTAAAEAETAVTAPAALERVVHLSFGDTPAEEYVRQLAADHLIHAWDLAVATGADPTMDEAAVRACADWFAGREHLYRQSGAIGPAAEVPPTASEQDRLLAAFGRNPAWTP